MKRKNRDINIFSMSALDLFASAMGAFVIIAVIMMPYFPNTGDSPERVADVREELEGQIAEILRQLEETRSDLDDTREALEDTEDKWDVRVEWLFPKRTSFMDVMFGDVSLNLFKRVRDDFCKSEYEKLLTIT